VAEITTVSDKGLDQLNPVEALSAELNKIVASRGLNPGRFWFRVGVHNEPRYKGGPKVKLKLTGRARFAETIFDANFHNFLEHISRNLQSPNQYLRQTDQTDVEIRYNPDQQFGGGTYLNYTAVYSLADNLLYNSLSEKASQLNGTNFHGPIGIILCDGDCEFLSQPPIGNLSYTLDEVIRHFLIENSPIHFILTCVVKDCGDRMSTHLGPFQLTLHLYKGLRFEEIPFDLWQIVQNLVFPMPKRNAVNARNVLKGPKPHEGSKHGGEITVKEHEATVKVSTRTLMEFLAGRISQEEFFQRCCGSFAKETFEQALRACKLIVSVERSLEEDDDWLIFQMSGPDPAISQFSFPRKNR